MSHSLPRTPWIGLSQVAADDEGWWHLTVAAADGTFAVQQECYVYQVISSGGPCNSRNSRRERLLKFDSASGIADPRIGCGFAYGSSTHGGMRPSLLISELLAMTCIDGRRASPSLAMWRR